LLHGSTELQPSPPERRQMMDSDSSRLDSIAFAEAVARAVRDIDASSFERRDVLLFDLLSAAWPEPIAQNQ